MTNELLIKALRCCIVDFNSTQSRLCNECPYRIYADGKKACENKAKRDAADALEALQAEWERLKDELNNAHNEGYDVGYYAGRRDYEPKEGEWIEQDDGDSIFFKCSVCGKIQYNVLLEMMQGEYHYCPNCGAKMKTVTDCHTLKEGER